VSFRETKENIRTAEKFFERAKRDKMRIALELRGWDAARIRALCKRFNLIDCCDPFAREPTWIPSVAYFRLHGSPPGPRMYRYRYTDKDLRCLKHKLAELKAKEIYCMFNNGYSMAADAARFLQMLKEG
jgi:uncharacterized protein YecE (DUF72 family)